MRGLEKRNDIYRVRVAIPADLRRQWGKREEIISLNTTDENDAITRGAPVIADIKRRIADMRRPAARPGPSAPQAMVRLTIPQTFDAIRAWRHATVENAYLDAFNGSAASGDPVKASALRYALQHNSTIDQIADFDATLADVLAIPADHPVVQRPNVREWLRDAWSDVETFKERFARDDFNGWPEEYETPATPPAATSPVTLAGMKLSELRDAWDSFKPLETRQKGYIRRLIEFLGDVDIATVQPLDMDRLLIELRRFPMTKKPSDDRLALHDLIAAYEGTEQPRLHIKTIWNWTVVYKAMFAFAVSRRKLTYNPAADMMKKPSAEEANDRNPYSEADLDRIFTRPMFKGFTGSPHAGYRNKPGKIVVQDARYWLPIVALHTGMRLEELASLRTTEVIDENGILAFDLTHRPLKGEGSVKNASARRIVPLHQRLFDLGFAAWMEKQDGFVFPGLTTNGEGKRGAGFGKWWGLWCGANAEAKGQGIDDPSLTFHSFRHSFKRAARQSPVKEEIHDLLTGHRQGNTVARAYGAGADLKTLRTAMDQIPVLHPRTDGSDSRG